MRHPIREEILTAFVLLAGVAPVSMVSLATLQAMAEKPPDAKAQMQILHAFMSGYTVWILIPLLADSATS